MPRAAMHVWAGTNGDAPASNDRDGAGGGSRRVAVVGAGAAGLVAARELRREGHRVTVFERGSEVGGVWVFNDEVEGEDLLGVNSKQRRAVHGSMYKSLRTNLPRELMGFMDYPFDVESMQEQGRLVDRRRFCSHEEVRSYLEGFAHTFGLSSLIQFDTEVVDLRPLDRGAANQSSEAGCSAADSSVAWPRWEVRSRSLEAAGSDTGAAAADGGDDCGFHTEEYDAVVVCNGHFSQPHLPEQVKGIDCFPGLQMHSHNFRSCNAFAGMRVVVVGASASGEDICRDIAGVAKEVYLSARRWQNPAWAEDGAAPIGPHGNVWRRRMLQELTPDGAALLEDGSRIAGVDAVVFCTGYEYHLPFLAGVMQRYLHTVGPYVAPLFQHILPPAAPSLSFIGIPWKVVPFPQFELQARWVAKVLNGTVQLPSQAHMEEHAAQLLADMEASGEPMRYLHCMGDSQWQYNSWLAQQCGLTDMPQWRQAMYEATGQTKRRFPETYRDSWTDFSALSTALQEFAARKPAGSCSHSAATPLPSVDEEAVLASPS